MVYLFLGSLVVFMLIGVPIAFSMLLSSLVYIVLSGSVPPFTAVFQMAGGIDSFPLVAVPFFILAGNLMNSAGITNRIFDFASDLVCWLRGGLGHVTVVSAVIFSGISGTAIGDASGLGTVTVKAMKDRGYPLPFAVGVISAASTMGPIIPPSLAMVIYGVQSNTSIGKLFLGGFVPGFMMALLMMLFVSYYAWKNNFGKESSFAFGPFCRSFTELVSVLAAGTVLFFLWKAPGLSALVRFILPVAVFVAVEKLFKFNAFLALITPALLIGGILSGLFTPTEAAVAAVFWALFLGLFVYRTLSFKDFVTESFKSMETTVSIMFIVGAAAIFGWVLTTTQITDALGAAVLSLGGNQLVFLFLVNIFLLVVGCFMETIAAITILVPVLLPLLTRLQIDTVHFGLILVLNLMIGLLTPPVGLILFVMARVSGMKLGEVLKAVLPWFIPLFAALILITVFPQIVLWLPGLFFGN